MVFLAAKQDARFEQLPENERPVGAMSFTKRMQQLSDEAFETYKRRREDEHFNKTQRIRKQDGETHLPQRLPEIRAHNPFESKDVKSTGTLCTMCSCRAPIGGRAAMGTYLLSLDDLGTIYSTYQDEKEPTDWDYTEYSMVKNICLECALLLSAHMIYPNDVMWTRFPNDKELIWNFEEINI